MVESLVGEADLLVGESERLGSLVTRGLNESDELLPLDESVDFGLSLDLGGLDESLDLGGLELSLAFGFVENVMLGGLDASLDSGLSLDLPLDDDDSPYLE